MSHPKEMRNIRWVNLVYFDFVTCIAYQNKERKLKITLEKPKRNA